MKTTPTYSIFISYKRQSLSTANNLHYRLTTRGYSTFFDLDEMRQDNFDEQIFRYIDGANDIFILLEKGSLDGAKDPDWEHKDWFCIEIAYALRKKKNIIPVLLNGYKMPEAASLPAALRELVKKNAPEFYISYFDDYLDKLIEKGYITARPELQHNSLAAFKFYANEDCQIYQDGKLVCSVTGNTDVPYFLPVSHKGDYRFKCVLPAAQKIKYLNERIDANEEKVVEIKWSAFEVKAERKRRKKRTYYNNSSNWWQKTKDVLEIVGYIFLLVITFVGFWYIYPDDSPIEPTAKELLESRDRCVEAFDTHYKNSNIDNIDALQSACTYLDSIRIYESNSAFEGEKVYPEKCMTLRTKANVLYQIADGKYQRAPQGSTTRQNLLTKRNRIQSITKSIPQ